MSVQGKVGEDGRFIQEEGEVDIVCLSEPIVIIETDIADVTLTFYSNNEPHVHFKNIRQISIKFFKMLADEIREKFNKLGYDKIYTLIEDTDIQSKRLVNIIGFIPKVIYTTPIGVKLIKYEMETE